MYIIRGQFLWVSMFVLGGVMTTPAHGNTIIQAVNLGFLPGAGSVRVISQSNPSPFAPLTSPLKLAVLGLANTSVINSAATITGNEGVYTGGSISNAAPSTVVGNVYETTAGQYSGPGAVTGSVIVDQPDLQASVNNALADAVAFAALTPDQVFAGISSPTTIVGNGGENVIQINGNITSSITLSGSSSDVFIINVTGTLTLTGSTALSVAGGVQTDNVVYNFTGNSGNITAQVGNVIHGTILAPNYSMNNIDGTWYGELIGSGTIKVLSNSSVIADPFIYTDPSIANAPEPGTAAMIILAGICIISGIRLRRPARATARSRQHEFSQAR